MRGLNYAKRKLWKLLLIIENSLGYGQITSLVIGRRRPGKTGIFTGAGWRPPEARLQVTNPLHLRYGQEPRMQTPEGLFLTPVFAPKYRVWSKAVPENCAPLEVWL